MTSSWSHQADILTKHAWFVSVILNGLFALDKKLLFWYVQLIPHQGGLKMNKILEKIKNFFSGKSEKKEEPKPQQEEPKAQEKPKEQK